MLKIKFNFSNLSTAALISKSTKIYFLRFGLGLTKIIMYMRTKNYNMHYTLHSTLLNSIQINAKFVCYSRSNNNNQQKKIVEN